MKGSSVKLAVLLLSQAQYYSLYPLDAHSAEDEATLPILRPVGTIRLQKHHLELLGYSVVHIAEFEWAQLLTAAEKEHHVRRLLHDFI